MKDEKEKRGIFKLLTGSKKTKKSSCCGSFEIEELQEENTGNEDEKNPE